jgi:hypothetical protein
MDLFNKFWNDTDITDDPEVFSKYHSQLIDIDDLNELSDLADKVESLLTPVNH